MHTCHTKGDVLVPLCKALVTSMEETAVDSLEIVVSFLHEKMNDETATNVIVKIFFMAKWFSYAVSRVRVRLPAI